MYIHTYRKLNSSCAGVSRIESNADISPLQSIENILKGIMLILMNKFVFYFRNTVFRLFTQVGISPNTQKAHFMVVFTMWHI